MKNVLVKIVKDLDSTGNTVGNLENHIRGIRDKVNIDDFKYYNILIAATEAVNNAVYHGNKGDSNEKVHFELILSKKQLIITIIDKGNGFNLNKVKDPRMPENLMNDHGRGIFLIRELSDEADFISNKNGTKVVIKFNL